MDENRTTQENQSNQSPDTQTATIPTNMKFCKHCGEKIDAEAVLCIKCGKQVEELKSSGSDQSKIEVNVSQNQASSNVNTNTIHAGMLKKPKNKWTAVLLCFFLGVIGGHKFYEGKVGMGILYIFTAGLFGIGVVLDFIILLFKPNPYYI